MTARAIVRPSGEFDVGNVAQLEGMIASKCLAGGEVVIDLTDVSYMDSSAIGVLLRAYRQYPNCRFSIIAPEGSLPRRVLTILGIEEIIPIHAKDPETS